MSTEISAAHEHIELSHNLDIRFDLFHASDIYIMPHWHNALEINFVLDGTFEVTADGQTFLLQSGDCIIINSKVIHATRYVKNTKSLLIQIPYPLLKKYIPDMPKIFFDVPVFAQDPETKAKLDTLKTILQNMISATDKASLSSANTLRFQSLLFDFLYHGVGSVGHPRLKENIGPSAEQKYRALSNSRHIYDFHSFSLLI